MTLTIGPGTIHDYDAMSCWHYRGGRPATFPLVLCASMPGLGRVGVLVVSMPTLNASWRGRAWPGRYTLGDKRSLAQRLNREVRTISRVIVDPRVRGLGVATALVRAYLRSPVTPATEAVSLMGRLTQFFERAGMRAYQLDPCAQARALLDALVAVGLEPWALADQDIALDVAERSPWIVARARAWARASPSTRPEAGGEPTDVLGLVARTLSAAPVAYAHVKEQ